MSSAIDAHAKLDDQLCFALYAASRAVMGAYKEHLAQHGLTYPQYITLVAIWEQDGSKVRELGAVLDLDSGTLSPLLQRLERDGWITRKRDDDDERVVRVFSTPAGRKLEREMDSVRAAVEASTGLTDREFRALRENLQTLRVKVKSPDA